MHRTIVANSRMMRTIPRSLAGIGFDLVWSRGYLVADIGRMDFWAPGITSFRVLLPKASAMSETKAGAFADSLERASAESRFFGPATSIPPSRNGAIRQQDQEPGLWQPDCAARL